MDYYYNGHVHFISGKGEGVVAISGQVFGLHKLSHIFRYLEIQRYLNVINAGFGLKTFFSLHTDICAFCIGYPNYWLYNVTQSEV